MNAQNFTHAMDDRTTNRPTEQGSYGDIERDRAKEASNEISNEIVKDASSNEISNEIVNATHGRVSE